MWDCRKILILIFITAIHITASRKYDIEEEALKIYGEDLKSVVKRFRRTPEYLEILSDKIKDIIEASSSDAYLQIVYHFFNKLQEQVKQMVPSNEDENSTDINNAIRQGPAFNGYQFPFLGRDRNRFSGHEKFPLPGLRTPDDEDTRKRSPAERLDRYPLLNQVLTLQERNMFRDLGFEYAGKMIHAMIKSMGSEDFSLKSTKFLPADHEKATSPTTPHDHEIISTQHHESTHAESQTQEAFVYKYRSPKRNQLGKSGKQY